MAWALSGTSAMFECALPPFDLTCWAIATSVIVNSGTLTSIIYYCSIVFTVIMAYNEYALADAHKGCSMTLRRCRFDTRVSVGFASHPL